jgi:hypothetical protein
MFDQPITIPDRISTLELSKLWLCKALENLNAELEASEPDADLDGEQDAESDA